MVCAVTLLCRALEARALLCPAIKALQLHALLGDLFHVGNNLTLINFVVLEIRLGCVDGTQSAAP